MKIHCSNEISRPPASVFPWIADPKKAMQWQRDVKHTQIVVETPGVAGTTFKEIVQQSGSELEITGVVTDFLPNEQVAFHLSTRIHEFDLRYALQRIENGTRISAEATIRWKFPMNVASLFVGNRLQRQLTEQLLSETERLREICERE